MLGIAALCSWLALTILAAAPLLALAQEPKPAIDIRCELEGETEKYEFKLQIQPKVTFNQGMAVKASLNWGKIEAPKLAKTALWSATAADNSFGVLQSVVVEDIDEFICAKCMEARAEWQGK